MLATLMYLALCLMNPQGGIRAVVAMMYGPFFFVSGNLLRVLACAAGGYLSGPEEGLAPRGSPSG